VVNVGLGDFELQSATFLWRQFQKIFQRFHEINCTRQLFSKLAFVTVKLHPTKGK